MEHQTVGIIGAGTVGKLVAQYTARTGRKVVVSNSRGPQSLAEVAAQTGPGVRAGEVQEAAEADIVVLAIPWPVVETTLLALPAWHGQVLIDATNAIRSYTPERTEVFDFGDLTSSEVVAGLAPGARLVKAFNTLPYPLLSATPRVDGTRRVAFMSGDDRDAKQGVRDLLDDIGYAPVDLGDLARGARMQQAAGPLAGLDLRLAAT